MIAGPTATGSQEERKGRKWRIPSDFMAIICAWLLSLGPELFLLPVARYSLFDFVHSSPRCITPSRHPNMNESQRGNTRKAVVKEGGVLS